MFYRIDEALLELGTDDSQSYSSCENRYAMVWMFNIDVI
jgi:hypothetical protein